MREHETRAPSLGEVIAALDAAEIQECHVNGDKADVISAPPGSNWLNEHRIIARCSTGPLWIKQAVAIAKALNFVRSLAAAPPTTMAEAVASARAEGVKEGLERAARIIEKSAVPALRGVSAAIRALIPAPPTLIPGGSSDV